MKTFMVDNSYASECYSKHMDYLKEHPEEELDQVVGKINDEEIKRGIYNYYYINEEMTSYYSGGQGLQTDDASVKETNESIFNSIAQNKALVKYCEENNIEIKQEEIDNALQTKQSIQKMMFQTDDELNQYLENYFLTKEKYDEYQKEDAKEPLRVRQSRQKLQKMSKSVTQTCANIIKSIRILMMKAQFQQSIF